MKNFEIEYATNIVDRPTITMAGTSKTEVYLKFVEAFPIHYIITEIKEL